MNLMHLTTTEDNSIMVVRVVVYVLMPHLLQILEHSKFIVFIVRINHLDVFLLEYHPNIHFVPDRLS